VVGLPRPYLFLSQEVARSEVNTPTRPNLTYRFITAA